MFGVALDIKYSDFNTIINSPKSIFVGLTSQLLLLPLVTILLVYITNPSPSLALGMFLVAACPGGNISNFMSSLARGNVALSVSMTAITTLLAVIITPISFTLMASSYEPTSNLLRNFTISFSDVIYTVGVILALPLTLGILFNNYFPMWAMKLKNVIRPLSILIFIAFVLIAFLKNKDIFLNYFQYIVYLVFAHNGLAFLAAYLFSGVMGLALNDRRSITIETGIQNSGLGLVIIFAFFDGLGGMAMITAWWGIWHIISGLTVATFWSYRPVLLSN